MNATLLSIAWLVSAPLLQAQDLSEPIDFRALLEPQSEAGTNLSILIQRVGAISEFDLIVVLSGEQPDRSIVIGIKGINTGRVRGGIDSDGMSIEVYIPNDPSKGVKEKHIRFFRKVAKDKNMELAKMAWELTKQQQIGIQSKNAENLWPTQIQTCYFLISSDLFAPKNSYLAGGMIVSPKPGTKSRKFLDMLYGISNELERSANESYRDWKGNLGQSGFEWVRASNG